VEQWSELQKMMSELIKRYERLQETEGGAAGYILLWLLGVPASLLFVIFLLRGCN
jgi:hypothetical protein